MLKLPSVILHHYTSGAGVLGILSSDSLWATQIRYILEQREPAEHEAQNTHELFLTGRQWIDFVSFDPRLEDGLRLFIVRVHRSEEALAFYAGKVQHFLKEVEAELATVQALRYRESRVA